MSYLLSSKHEDCEYELCREKHLDEQPLNDARSAPKTRLSRQRSRKHAANQCCGSDTSYDLRAKKQYTSMCVSVFY